MKIKYNLEYNYFFYFNAAQGIVSFKQSIYRDEYKPVKTYTERGLTLVKLTIISFVLMLIFMLINSEWLLSKILSFIFAAAFAITFVFYFIFISFYKSEKSRCHRGELTINKNGILDTTDDGIRIGLPWTFIEALIITDKVICFTTKNMTFFFLEVAHLDEVMEAIKTYQESLKIIDKRLYKPVKIDEAEDEQAELISSEKSDNALNEEAKIPDVKEEAPLDTEVEDSIKELEGN